MLFIDLTERERYIIDLFKINGLVGLGGNYWNIDQYKSLGIDGILYCIERMIPKDELLFLIHFDFHYRQSFFDDSVYKKAIGICNKYLIDFNLFNIKNESEYECSENIISNKVKQKNIYSGYVYFIQDSYGIIKIGKTRNMNQRMKKYITENSKELNLIKKIKYNDYTKAEFDWHERYKEKRIRGEWFELSEEDLEFIKSQ